MNFSFTTFLRGIFCCCSTNKWEIKATHKSFCHWDLKVTYYTDSNNGFRGSIYTAFPTDESCLDSRHRRPTIWPQVPAAFSHLDSKVRRCEAAHTVLEVSLISISPVSFVSVHYCVELWWKAGNSTCKSNAN